MSLSDQDRAHIWAVGANTDSPLTPTLRTRIQTMARQLLWDALDPSLTDDRFDNDFTAEDSFRAALAMVGDSCVGFLGGSVNRGRLQLSGIITPTDGPLSPAEHQAASESQATQSGTSSMQEVLQELLDALESGFTDPTIEFVELWAHPETRWSQGVAAANGFEPLRALHQLRCQLPVTPDPMSREPQIPVTTRPFEPDRDIQALITVNNRAFVDHPDQGGMTATDLRQAMKQSWFSADGLRVFDDPEIPETLAGFCWTKIHTATGSQPELGEIYAIGIDPRHHGKGLGGPMTAAGLDWLTEQGLTNGMLYVEASNEPALKTYRRLGFLPHRTDRAWIRTTNGGSANQSQGEVA